MTDFNWRANLEPCYLIFSRYCGDEKLKEFHEELDYDYDVTEFGAHTRSEHFLIIFFDFSSVHVEFILVY